jgi:hypothetical protein
MDCFYTESIDGSNSTKISILIEIYLAIPELLDAIELLDIIPELLDIIPELLDIIPELLDMLAF